MHFRWTILFNPLLLIIISRSNQRDENNISAIIFSQLTDSKIGTLLRCLSIPRTQRERYEYAYAFLSERNVHTSGYDQCCAFEALWYDLCIHVFTSCKLSCLCRLKPWGSKEDTEWLQLQSNLGLIKTDISLSWKLFIEHTPRMNNTDLKIISLIMWVGRE